MGQASIPVDLFNPGQVFACLGFLEAADVLLGNAEGGVDWTDEADVRFLLRADGERNPCEAVLGFLSEANVYSLAPIESELSTSKWDVATQLVDDGSPYPFRQPNSPAILPVVLEGKFQANDHARLMIDHWGDTTSRDAVKFWAGAGGYPGAALAKDALDLFRNQVGAVIDNPFSFYAPQSSSFRFDWRRDYIPIDVGFSPNDHADLTMVGFPIVELLAAIGLCNARPKRVDKLKYRYSVLGTSDNADLFDPIFLRAALGCASLGFPSRDFVMYLGWPGKENQARCITNIVEETQT